MTLCEYLRTDWQQTKKDTEKLRTLGNALYWDLYYTVGYSSMAGLGNGLATAEQGGDFSHSFGEAFVNNFPLGAFVNLAYPIAFNKLRETGHYRAYANLFTLGVNLGFLAWHYFTGTEHPLQAILPNIAIGLAIANRHVSETQRIILGEAGIIQSPQSIRQGSLE